MVVVVWGGIGGGGGGVGVVVLVVVVVNKTGWDSLMLVQSPRAIKLGKAPLVLIGIEL